MFKPQQVEDGDWRLIFKFCKILMDWRTKRTVCRWQGVGSKCRKKDTYTPTECGEGKLEERIKRQLQEDNAWLTAEKWAQSANCKALIPESNKCKKFYVWGVL